MKLPVIHSLILFLFINNQANTLRLSRQTHTATLASQTHTVTSTFARQTHTRTIARQTHPEYGRSLVPLYHRLSSAPFPLEILLAHNIRGFIFMLPVNHLLILFLFINNQANTHCDFSQENTHHNIFWSITANTHYNLSPPSSNSYPANFFVLKMLSAFYVCCIYSKALQTRFY